MNIIIAYWADYKQESGDPFLGFYLSKECCDFLEADKFSICPYFDLEQYWVKRNCFSEQNKLEVIEDDLCNCLDHLVEEAKDDDPTVLIIVPRSLKNIVSYLEQEMEILIFNELHEGEEELLPGVKLCLLKKSDGKKFQILPVKFIGKDDSKPNQTNTSTFGSPNMN